MYVINLTHFLDAKGAIAPERGSARKMADFLSATHCSGVSYIGNSARMFSCFLPLVQAAEPCSA